MALPTRPDNPSTADAARRLLLEVRAAQMFRDLQATPIEAILLKGASTSKRLYPAIGRPYGDIDFFVSRSALDRARACFIRLGFRCSPALLGDRPQPSETWVRDRDGTNVDLHWTLAGATAPFPDVGRVLWANREAMWLRGHGVVILNVPAWLMHLALHAAQHGPNYPVPLEDLKRALDSFSRNPWRAAASVAHQVGAVQAMAQGLRLVEGGEDLARALDLPEDAPRSVVLQATGASSEALFLSWWWQLPIRGRVSLIIRKFFPPREYLCSWWSFADRGLGGMVVAYAWRPFWLLFRGFRAIRHLRAGRSRGGRSRRLPPQ